MQYATPACQPDDAPTGETSRYIPPAGGTPCPTEATPSATHGHVHPSLQWVATTESRHAQDPYSWMQAVHWMHGSGHYVKRRSHGPGFNATTVRVAQALAQLTPCRPGVGYLARVLRLSERSVQYHLEMLRETGLLAYIVRGTRSRAHANQASEFARVIPPVFDTALGIRTIGEGVQRRPVGIAEEHRGAIGKLAKKAARKIRGRRRNTNRPGAKATSARRAVCTPKQAGTSTSSTAGTTTYPPESKLASGTPKSPTPKKPSSRKPRALNRVGRRYQLARQLIQRVWWLNRAALPRIAWIVRDVADHGWTAEETIAWLNINPDPDMAHRPSGFLAYRLRLAHTCPGWTLPEHRAARVEEDRDTRRAEHGRHTEQAGDWQPPTNPRTAQQALAGLQQGLAAYSARQRALGLDDLSHTTAAPRQAVMPCPDDPATAAADLAAFLGLDTIGAAA